MTHADGTPEDEDLPTFVDDQLVLSIPVFVTRESHRSASAQIREKIAAATVGDLLVTQRQPRLNKQQRLTAGQDR